VEVRPYIAEDLETVIHVWEAAFSIGHPFLTDQFLDSERKSIPSKYLPNGDAWVALVEDKVIGFMILHGNEVGALFVNPDYHGTGAGYALMNKASEVFSENTIGNKFYARYGFVQIGEYLHQGTGKVMLCLEYDKDG